MMRALGRVIVIPIRLYQRFMSPLVPDRCRYYPSCSHYAVDAIRIRGPITGVALATWRICRCNPWSHGGIDYVPTTGWSRSVSRETSTH